MGVIQRSIWIRLASHRKPNLTRLNYCDFEIGHRTGDSSRRVRLVHLAGISNYKGSVPISLGLQPDQLVAVVVQPLGAASSRIIGNKSRAASGEVKHTDLVGLGVGFEGVRCLGVHRQSTCGVGNGAGAPGSPEENPGSVSGKNQPIENNGRFCKPGLIELTLD